jgi:UDP-N-acetylmuramate dehydrogenase
MTPEGIRRDFPLSRLTTIGAAGRPSCSPVRNRAKLEAVLAWAAAEGVEVGVVGSGSNLLIADAGVRRFVVKLDRELSQITLDATRIDCGGGARLPAVSAQSGRAGLGGIEFGINISRTVAGAVRMNAEWARP